MVGQGTLDPSIEVRILAPESWALSSAAERPAHNRLVAGSNPAGPTGLQSSDLSPASKEGMKDGP
jgi:hypothetical protein